MSLTPREHQHLHELQPSMENTVKMRVTLSGSHWQPSTSSDEIPSTCWAWPPLHNLPRFRSRASRWDELLACCSSATRWVWIRDLPVLKQGDEEVFEMMIFIQLLFRFFALSLRFCSRTVVLRITAFYTGTWTDMTGPLLNIKVLLSKLASKKSVFFFGNPISPPLPKLSPNLVFPLAVFSKNNSSIWVYFFLFIFFCVRYINISLYVSDLWDFCGGKIVFSAS